MMATNENPITVSILGSVRAARAAGWDEGDLLYQAKVDGVLIDADDEQQAAVFGISRYYVPEAWLKGLERPEDGDDNE